MVGYGFGAVTFDGRSGVAMKQSGSRILSDHYSTHFARRMSLSGPIMAAGAAKVLAVRPTRTVKSMVA